MRLRLVTVLRLHTLKALFYNFGLVSLVDMEGRSSGIYLSLEEMKLILGLILSY